MLVPLTREKFDQLIPLIATGPQYKYYWGKFPEFLQRLLISVVSAAIVLLLKVVFRLDFGPIVFFLGLFGALYWFWGPVFWASLRNSKCRRYKYVGFFRGRVLDYWITEQLIGTQETVNNRGDLVIVENREKTINLEVGDQSGFIAEFSAPLRISYKAINTGQIAEMLVFSNRADLGRIEEISDIYIPSRELWVSDYPWIRRDFFTSVSRRIGKEGRRDTRRWDDRYSDERYSDERYSDDEYSDERYSDDRYSGGGYSDDGYSNDGYSDARYLGDRYSDRKYSDDGYSDEKYSDDEYSDQRYSDKRYSDDRYREPRRPRPARDNDDDW